MSAERTQGLFIPAAATLLGLVALLALGTWQLERKAWKEGLIATLERRLNETPIALPPPAQWAAMTPDSWEFTRVRLPVQFLKQSDALVYTSGSAIRDDVKAAGYFVFSPALGPQGRQVVVNRGYVPARAYPAAGGVIEIVGAVRFPEQPSWFVSAHDAAGEIWTVRDSTLMAKVKGWGEVAPFYIEMESPVPAGGLPHPAPLKVRLRNEHLQYAITWYGLAAVLAVIFAIWAFRRRSATPR